jgi:hypothetical protein
MATRAENPFGKRPDELRHILNDLDTVKPKLRAVADHEIRTIASVDDVVTSILGLLDEPSPIEERSG